MLIKQFIIFWYDTDKRQMFVIGDERELDMLIEKHNPKMIKSYFSLEEAIKKDKNLWRGMNLR